MSQKKKYDSLCGEDHHVVRRCNVQSIERDTVTNEVVGLFPSAMKLRVEINEDYLSASWLEHCAGDKTQRLLQIVAIYQSKAINPLSANSGVAVLKADRIVEIGSDHNKKLSVTYYPNKKDQSYTKIKGLPLDNSDDLLLLDLAAEGYGDFTLLKDLREHGST